MPSFILFPKLVAKLYNEINDLLLDLWSQGMVRRCSGQSVRTRAKGVGMTRHIAQQSLQGGTPNIPQQDICLTAQPTERRNGIRHMGTLSLIPSSARWRHREMLAQIHQQRGFLRLRRTGGHHVPKDVKLVLGRLP
jgi:hypothetical protein